MVLASEASLEVHEGIIDAHAPAQVQDAATALVSPFCALNHEQSGSFVFVPGLFAPAAVVVSVSRSGYEDRAADCTIAVAGDTDAQVEAQIGQPLVVGAGEVEELGCVDASHTAPVETPENPKRFERVALAERTPQVTRNLRRARARSERRPSGHCRVSSQHCGDRATVWLRRLMETKSMSGASTNNQSCAQRVRAEDAGH